MTKTKTRKRTSNIPEDKPAVLEKFGLLGGAICVPKGWTDGQATAWVEGQNPAGTSGGWQVNESHEANRSACTQRPNCVHLIINC